jgi:hypothetical protein
MLSFYPAVDTGFRLWGCELAQELAVRGRMGLGSATLNGEPLYSDYQIHFMVTQGMRGRAASSCATLSKGRRRPPAP